jgi:hypothetical protein
MSRNTQQGETGERREEEGRLTVDRVEKRDEERGVGTACKAETNNTT